MSKQSPVKKEHLLIVGSIILLFISYKLAFKHTIELWNHNRQLSEILARSSNISLQPDYLKRKNNNIDKVISFYKADTTLFRTYSINNISIIAEKENVKLSEVPPQDPSFNTDEFIVQKLEFEGDFFSLTRLLYQLQQTRGIGIVRSFALKQTNNSHTHPDQQLILAVYLEIAK